MDGHKTVLVALELASSNDDKQLLDKVKAFVAPDAKIYVIHAVEHTSSYGAAYGISAGIDVEQVLLDEAKKMMANFANSHGIPAERQLVKVGAARFVILDEAEDIKADLIVTGSHGRHGVRLLLGSTANAILHGAKCDVLAVRVFE